MAVPSAQGILHAWLAPDNMSAVARGPVNEALILLTWQQHVLLPWMAAVLVSLGSLSYLLQLPLRACMHVHIPCTRKAATAFRLVHGHQTIVCLIDLAENLVRRQICHHLFVRWVRTATNRSDTIHMPAMARQLMLCSLPPDVLHVIVRLNCSDMHSTDSDAAAAAQDAATALRLTCRTLRAPVDATVAQLDIRASSSADLAQAAARFPGLQHAWAVHTL